MFQKQLVEKIVAYAHAQEKIDFKIQSIRKNYELRERVKELEDDEWIKAVFKFHFHVVGWTLQMLVLPFLPLIAFAWINILVFVPLAVIVGPMFNSTFENYFVLVKIVLTRIIEMMDLKDYCFTTLYFEQCWQLVYDSFCFVQGRL